MMNMSDFAFSNATKSRLRNDDAKLLVIDKEGYAHYKLSDLPMLLPENALLVVNDAATIPALFVGVTVNGEPIELRLTMNLSRNSKHIKRWQAITFGAGSWRIDTDIRDKGPRLKVGDVLYFNELVAQVDYVYDTGLVEISFQGSNSTIWQLIFKYGRPIQYSHLEDDLELWDIQTPFSSIPVAFEAPSASFQLSWDLVHQATRYGVELVSITHATSISSTGRIELDSYLPFPEHYWISKEAANKITLARQEGRPIVAVGTSVVRALEDVYKKLESIEPGHYIATLTINDQFQRQVVTDLFTGMHLPEASHIKLLSSFVNIQSLSTAYKSAVERSYLWHEYGDVNMILT